MKSAHLLSISLLCGALLSAHANTPPPAPTAATSAATSPERTNAEVRKIDKDAKKITLKHEEIKSLDMPPMTMVFNVKEIALLEKVKVGDKIRFSAEKSGSGYVVTTIEENK